VGNINPSLEVRISYGRRGTGFKLPAKPGVNADEKMQSLAPKTRETFAMAQSVGLAAVLGCCFVQD